jgi:hypothetical protein
MEEEEELTTDFRIFGFEEDEEVPSEEVPSEEVPSDQ